MNWNWLIYSNRIFIEPLSSKTSGDYFNWIGEIPEKCIGKVIEITGDIYTFVIPKQIKHFKFRTIDVKGYELWIPNINYPIEIEKADLIFIEGWCAFRGTHPSYYHRLSKIHFIYNPKFPLLGREKYIEQIIQSLKDVGYTLTYREYEKVKITHFYHRNEDKVFDYKKIILDLHNKFWDDFRTYLISPTSYFKDVLIMNKEDSSYLIKTHKKCLVYSPSSVFLIPAVGSKLLLENEIIFCRGILLIELK